jgi:hypothetical protein
LFLLADLRPPQKVSAMPSFLYVSTPASQSVIQDSGGTVSRYGYFVNREPCGRLKLVSNSKVIYIRQEDGFLINVSTREFAVANILVFYMFMCSFLALGLVASQDDLWNHLKEADKHFREIFFFMKTLRVDVSECKTPRILRRYMGDKTDSLCKALRLHGHLEASKALNIMYANGCHHSSLLTCFWPEYDFQKDLAIHSDSMFETLHSLYSGDLKCDNTIDYMDFVIDTIRQTHKLYNEKQIQVDDYAMAKCIDGSVVFNFQDPDAFQKWKHKKVSVSNFKLDATFSFVLSKTEPIQPSKLKRKLAKTSCMPLYLVCPHPQSIRQPIMEDLKHNLVDSEYKKLRTLLKDSIGVHWMDMNHKLWYYRSKMLDIAAQFRQHAKSVVTNIVYRQQALVMGVGEEIFREVGVLVRETERVCRSLEVMRVV